MADVGSSEWRTNVLEVKPGCAASRLYSRPFCVLVGVGASFLHAGGCGRW